MHTHGAGPDWDWFRRLSPPANEIPVIIPSDLVLVRTEDLAVWLDAIEVYSCGLRFDVKVRARENLPDGMLGHGPYGRTKDQFLLGLEFSDGTTVTNLVSSWPPMRNPSADPVLNGAGGGGGGQAASFGYFLSVLPPAGPVKLAFAWPTQRISERFFELDSDAIRPAAGRVVALWPYQQPTAPPPPKIELPDFEPGGWFDRAASETDSSD